MPVYHFNVRDGSEISDSDGTDLPDIRAARLEAVKLAGQMLLDRPGTFWEGSDWHLDVSDESGLTLFRLDFTATDMAAAPASKMRDLFALAMHAPLSFRHD
jgi:hypothetical protein